MHHNFILPIRLIVVTALLLISMQIQNVNAFAAWFVDRKVSCFTNLTPNEIIMNNAVLSHTQSREPSIHIDVTPLRTEQNTASPNSEYIVKFIIPDETKKRVPDLQFVLEISGGGTSDPPAKFTTAPPNGGIGCDDKRTHGKSTNNKFEAAIITINSNAVSGSKLEVIGGWAVGHESVTLTDKIVLIVGQGIVNTNNKEDAQSNKVPYEDTVGEEWDIDDFLDDDEAMAELEEAFLEEEREIIENEIEDAEEDAVEALEEKRIETDGLGSEINEAEEEIVEILEANKKDVNQALNSVEDEIMAEQVEREKEMERKGQKHLHNRAQRRDAERLHREKHDHNGKHMGEDKLHEMYRALDKKKKDEAKDKLSDLMDAKHELKESVQKLKKMDTREHENAARKHIKPLPKQELKVDMKELKQKAKERMKILSDKAADISDKLGVNELLEDPQVQLMRNRLRKGVPSNYDRGTNGKPLPPEGRHFLFVFFSFLILAGFFRWLLDSTRRARRRKERAA